MITFIKAQLPSDRKRLTHFIPYTINDPLRDDDDPLHHNSHTIPITDPVEMAQHAALYWGRIWEARGQAPKLCEIREYLTGYLRRVPLEALPSFPNHSHQVISPSVDMSWGELVERVITSSNNSSPGPDGVPFAAYRVLKDVCAPFILDMIIEAANGHPPPERFNHGRLFLIPKDESYKVLSTRPIVVNNADNRLFAKVMTAVMTPGTQAVAHSSQKGFIQGRVGSDNVTGLTELFYSHMEAKKQVHILQIDTRKAFDSIDHEYILTVLDVIGYPGWLIRVVLFLLTNVFAIPVVAAHTSVMIPIHRGVKQGCPLSPLLFVIAYDPLIWALHDLPISSGPPHTFAFADDLGIGSTSLPTIFLSMHVIDTFSWYSGLGVNVDKSRIASSKPFSRGDKVLFTSSPWKKVVITPQIKYLGIIIGRGVSTDMVFESPLRKLATRVRHYSSVIRALPLHLRIVTINIFLLSLFSYHIQFYMPGSLVTDRYNSLIGPLVVPFRGTAFSLSHLFASPRSDLYGLRTPLKNLWAWSMSTLANKFDLPAYHNSTVTVIPGFEVLEDPKWLSMRIPVHIAGSARDMLNHFLRSSEGAVVSDKYTPNSPKTRRLLYHTAVNLELGPVIQHPSAPGSLCTRLQRWNLGSVTDVDRLRTRWVLFTPSLPPHFLSHHLLMIFWALPTDERLSMCKGLTFLDPRPPPSYLSCYLCASFSPHSPMDSIEHLYGGHCLAAAAARTCFFKLLRLPHAFTIADSLLLSPTPLPSLITTRKLFIDSVLFFNLHLYSIRARHFKPLSHPPPLTSAINTLTQALVLAWNECSWRRMKHPTLTLSLHSHSRPSPPPRPTPPTSPRFIDPLIALAPPPGSLLFYTDGAACPNPGQTGAGVALIVDGSIMEMHSTPLGYGTNNIGEFYAMGIAIERADSITDDSNDPPCVYIISDSELAIGGISQNFKLSNSALKDLARVIKVVWRRLADRTKVTFVWIKGHADLKGNVTADALAGRASRLSSHGDAWRQNHCLTTTFVSTSPSSLDAFLRLRDG
jgi:ribonuclease HI